MSTFNSIEEAREFFKGDKYAAASNIRIDSLEDDKCVCSMDIVDDCHRNAVGGIMGGVLFTLGDFAFAVASNNMYSLTVALTVNINFLSGTKGSRLFAATKCVKDGRTTCVYDIDIYDDTGREVAKFIGTGYKIGA